MEQIEELARKILSTAEMFYDDHELSDAEIGKLLVSYINEDKITEMCKSQTGWYSLLAKREKGY